MKEVLMQPIYAGFIVENLILLTFNFADLPFLAFHWELNLADWTDFTIFRTIFDVIKTFIWDFFSVDQDHQHI